MKEPNKKLAKRIDRYPADSKTITASPLLHSGGSLINNSSYFAASRTSLRALRLYGAQYLRQPVHYQNFLTTLCTGLLRPSSLNTLEATASCAYEADQHLDYLTLQGNDGSGRSVHMPPRGTETARLYAITPSMQVTRSW